jgi:hypothetical protein
VIDIFAVQPHDPTGPGHDRSLKSVYHHSLLRNVWSVEDIKRSRSSTLSGDAYAPSTHSNAEDEFGTVRRSRQGELVSQITLD